MERKPLADTLQALEAILFTAPKPLNLAELQLTLLPHFPEIEVEASLKQLQKIYKEQKRAFHIGKVAGGYLLETVPEVAPYLSPLFDKKQSRLSKGALEVLSIIAFKQPITRPEIENIRGIESASHVESLMEGDWIESLGKKEVPGRPTLFGTTEKFLLHFGLDSVQDLVQKGERMS